MKKLTIGLVMLFAVPAILVSGIWGKTIGNFAVAHFTDHRPALTACSDWGSYIPTSSNEWFDEAGNKIQPHIEFFPQERYRIAQSWSEQEAKEAGYIKIMGERIHYCAPILTREQGRLAKPLEPPLGWKEPKFENGRYEDESVRIYSLDIGNLVRASIMLVLGIGGAALIVGARKNEHRNKNKK